MKQAMNMTELIEVEMHCKSEFKKFREKTGIVCRNCGTQKYYWLSTTEQYKCKKCGTKSSLRSGTMLERSKLPYSYWYAAIRLAIKGEMEVTHISDLQKKLGHKRYSAIWMLASRVKMAMLEDKIRRKILMERWIAQANRSKKFVYYSEIPQPSDLVDKLI